MNIDSGRVLALLDGFADPARRRGAADALAALLGCDQLMLFMPDPDLGNLVPVPGISDASESSGKWSAFAEQCLQSGTLTGRVEQATDTPARGCAVAGGVVAIMAGGSCSDTDLQPLRPLLVMLGALFRAELRLEDLEDRLNRISGELAYRAEEAERAKADAVSANRSKADFLANMSHELRTPLNAILGYTELLSMEVGGALAQEQHSHLGRIRTSSRQLLMVINDVLDLTKIESGEMVVQRIPERIGTAVDEAVGILEIEAEQQDVAIENMCTDIDMMYIGDEDRVRQIITNFLSNAIKFTSAGGRVWIRCGTADAPADAVLKGGAWAFITVEDTGIGMTEEELTRVFNPFVQAEMGRSRSHGGTGLGLTISRQLARLMGGDVTVRSEAGIGSRFTLWLPQTATNPGTIDTRLLVRSAQS